MQSNKNRGITLIALVVTIIVLLILAGISITMLTGQNGILNRAQEAKEKTELAQNDEENKLQGYNNIIKSYEDTLPTGEGTTPYLPDVTKFEKVKDTDLSTGLIIKETATGSEYVWVEVPKSITVYSTAGINIMNFTDEEYKKIEEDLHTYTADYRNGTGYNDVYSADSTEGWFTETGDTSYDTAKKKMLKSVYQNGGFWIGRYQAGVEANRRSLETATTIPLTKANLYPYTFVTRTKAKVLAEQVESGNYTSSLLFGVQWDLALKYIETKFIEKDASSDIKTILISNSTSIGNYRDNLWNITNKNAKYSTNYGSSFEAFPYQKESDANVLVTTGADESFSLMNIYDMAGNVWEWTLEKSDDSNNPCASMGGNYGSNGTNGSAGRRGCNSVSFGDHGIGFRISLY